MPCRTYRSRLLVLLLLLLSPGFGGPAVQMVHPCSTAASQAATHGGNNRSSHPAPTPGRPDAECHCFGTCYTSPTLQAVTAPTVAAPIPSFALIVRRPAEPERSVGRRLTLLQPPATAPPVLP
jgi:hypothetical protein